MTTDLNHLAARRRRAVEAMAVMVSVDPDALQAGTAAAWSWMNPQTTEFESALSLAASVLSAATKGSQS